MVAAFKHIDPYAAPGAAFPPSSVGQLVQLLLTIFYTAWPIVCFVLASAAGQLTALHAVPQLIAKGAVARDESGARFDVAVGRVGRSQLFDLRLETCY